MKSSKPIHTNQKGFKRHLVKLNRSKKPLILVLEEERAKERIREDRRKRSA